MKRFNWEDTEFYEEAEGPRMVGQRSEITLEAAMLRCMCNDPDSHQGEVCDWAVREELGVIASTSDGTIKIFEG